MTLNGRSVRLAGGILLAVVFLSGALGAWFWLELHREVQSTPAKVAAAVVWNNEIPPRSYVGRRAPGLALPDLRTGREVRLDGFRGKPTVLIFGSFSCDLFCTQIDDFLELRRKYEGQAHCVFVYIREAGHGNMALDRFMNDHPGLADRVRGGLDLYKMDGNCLDGRNSRLVERYMPWPERLLVLDHDGIVKWDSMIGIGPGGLRLESAEEELKICIWDAKSKS